MGLLATVLLLALTRAEIIQRMRAPVITQADGFVQVYADCDEDYRREFQHIIASFAAETIKGLYQGYGIKPIRFSSPELIIHIGNVRTNDTQVLTTVKTNENKVVTRLYVRNPACADILTFRTEIVRSFVRSLKKKEVSSQTALRIFHRANPRFRIADERQKLEEWLAGHHSVDDETALKYMRKVIEPGVATKRDILIFASRLFIYSRTFDESFIDGSTCVSLREAIALSRKDPRVRFLAFFKADQLLLFGGGRGDDLQKAATAYSDFLHELAHGEKENEELYHLLDEADRLLAVAQKGAR